MSPAHGMPNSQERRRDKGSFCLFGCLGLFIVGFLLLAGILALLFNFMQGALQDFTSPEPIELPKVEYSEEDAAALDTKIAPLFEALDDDSKGATVTLTAQELNILLQERDDLQPMGQWVHLSIEEGQLRGDLSIPLDALPFPSTQLDWLGLSGAYFNGHGEFEAGTNATGPYLFITRLDMGESQMSESTIRQMQFGNLLEPNDDMDQSVRRFLERISTLTMDEESITFGIKGEE